MNLRNSQSQSPSSGIDGTQAYRNAANAEVYNLLQIRIESLNKPFMGNFGLLVQKNVINTINNSSKFVPEVLIGTTHDEVTTALREMKSEFYETLKIDGKNPPTASNEDKYPLAA